MQEPKWAFQAMAETKKARTRKSLMKEQPGLEADMERKPKFEYILDGVKKRLDKKVCVITGGDSGIGRAVAIAFAAEGGTVVILYKEGKEEKDAADTVKYITRRYRKRCSLIGINVASQDSCRIVAKQIIEKFKRVDVLVNNAAVHYPTENLKSISAEQLSLTFEVNVYGMIYLTQELLPAMKSGSCIINTASVTAFRGSQHLMDYAATKGAIVAFTRSLSSNLAEKNIRVNGVAPGPVITPLIQASFGKQHLRTFGKKTPMQRAAQPNEIAPAYVFLASAEASYITGQFIHPNGGEIVNT